MARVHHIFFASALSGTPPVDVNMHRESQSWPWFHFRFPGFEATPETPGISWHMRLGFVQSKSQTISQFQYGFEFREPTLTHRIGLWSWARWERKNSSNSEILGVVLIKLLGCPYRLYHTKYPKITSKFHKIPNSHPLLSWFFHMFPMFPYIFRDSIFSRHVFIVVPIGSTCFHDWIHHSPSFSIRFHHCPIMFHFCPITS